MRSAGRPTATREHGRAARVTRDRRAEQLGEHARALGEPARPRRAHRRRPRRHGGQRRLARLDRPGEVGLALARADRSSARGTSCGPRPPEAGTRRRRGCRRSTTSSITPSSWSRPWTRTHAIRASSRGRPAATGARDRWGFARALTAVAPPSHACELAPRPAHARPSRLSSATSASTRRAPSHHAGSSIRKGCRISVCAPAPSASSAISRLVAASGRSGTAALPVRGPQLVEALHQVIGVDQLPVERHHRQPVRPPYRAPWATTSGTRARAAASPLPAVGSPPGGGSRAPAARATKTRARPRAAASRSRAA